MVVIISQVSVMRYMYPNYLLCIMSAPCIIKSIHLLKPSNSITLDTMYFFSRKGSFSARKKAFSNEQRSQTDLRRETQKDIILFEDIYMCAEGIQTTQSKINNLNAYYIHFYEHIFCKSQFYYLGKFVLLLKEEMSDVIQSGSSWSVMLHLLFMSVVLHCTAVTF